MATLGVQSLRSGLGRTQQEEGDAHVAITTVPMGCVGAVDLIQHIARRLVFNIAGVPRASEVSSAGSFPPQPPYSLVCMDGLDVVSSSNALAPSFILRFQNACDCLQLPLRAGKRVVRASSAPILGVELDEAQGILRHARDKGHSLVFAMLFLLRRSQWSVSALQHCVGLCTVAAGFRPILFSIL